MKKTVKKHKQTRYTFKTFNCIQCDVTFSSKNEQETHYSTHRYTENGDGLQAGTSDCEKPESFMCVLCNNAFLSKESLQTHFRSHATDQKNKRKPSVCPTGPIKCDICDVTFAFSNHAIQHKFKQHPEALEKHFCPTCGKSFTLKSLLEMHMESHKGAASLNKITCESCHAIFDNTQALKYHEDLTHKRVMKFYRPVETAPPSKKIRINNAGDVQSVYFCHICGSQYIVKFNLQKHLEAFHSSEERLARPTELVRCTACDALFYNRKAYENHKVGHTPDDLYVVDEQQRLKMVSRVDQDFDARRVQTVAEKFVPSYRKARRKSSIPAGKFEIADEEKFSPPTTPESSENECDSESSATVTHKLTVC